MERRDHVRVSVRDGEDQDLHVRTTAPQLAQHLQTRDTGHPQVEHGHVGEGAHAPATHGVAVRRPASDIEPTFLESPAKPLEKEMMVVGDQDPYALALVPHIFLDRPVPRPA